MEEVISFTKVALPYEWLGKMGSIPSINQRKLW